MQAESRPQNPRARLWWTAALILGLTLACYWPALNGGMLWDDDGPCHPAGLQSARRTVADLVRPPRHAAVLSRCCTARSGSSTGCGATRRSATTWQRAAARRGRVPPGPVLRRLGVPGALAWPGCSSPSIRSASNPSPGSRSRRTRCRRFYLLAALALPRFDRTGPAGGRAAYALACALFVLALLTKTVTATLPAALLVVLWWQRGRLSWRRDVLPLVPGSLLARRRRALHRLGRAHANRRGGRRFRPDSRRARPAGRPRGLVLPRQAPLALPLVFIYPRWDVRSAAPGGARTCAAALP